MDVPLVPVRPTVRLRFYYRANGVPQQRRGSAFFLGDWRSTLITAAHVVKLSSSEVATSIQLDVFDLAGRACATLTATAYAFPALWKTRDVAIVILSGSVAVQNPLEPNFPPTGEFPAFVEGFTNSGEPRTFDLSVRAGARWLTYTRGAALPRVSGGPVQFGGQAYGSHVGKLATGTGSVDVGFPLHMGILGELMHAAEQKQ